MSRPESSHSGGEERRPLVPHERTILTITEQQRELLNLKANRVKNLDISTYQKRALVTVGQDITRLNRVLETKTDLSAVLVGVALGIAKPKSLDKNFGPDNVAQLTEMENELMEKVITNHGKDAVSDEALATAVTFSSSKSNIQTHFRNIYTKLGAKDKVHAAALFASVKYKASDFPENFKDTILYLQETTNPLTESDIRILDMLSRGYVREDVERRTDLDMGNMNLNQRLQYIRGVLATPARVIAMHEGLRKGVILLPSPDKEGDITEFDHFTRQLMR